MTVSVRKERRRGDGDVMAGVRAGSAMKDDDARPSTAVMIMMSEQRKYCATSESNLRSLAQEYFEKNDQVAWLET